MSRRAFHFPPAVFNQRVAVFVDRFYEHMADLFARQGWQWEEPARTPSRWSHPEFVVRVASRFKDKAAHILEFAMSNLPGVASLGADGKPRLRHQHRFRVDIPRSYPADLGSIRVRAMLPLFHPRIGPSGTGAACVYVNGEIDRVLWSIVRQVLLDPDYVQPPKLFRGQDRGMNLAAMSWYETDPVGIHRRLLDLWAEAHGAKRFTLPAAKRSRVTIEG